MKTRIVIAVAIAALGVTAVMAQGDPIKARKELMKANSAQSRIARDMIQGKRPFDLAVAKKVLAQFESVAAKGKDLWPESSKTGGDTESLPAIWEHKADFDAKLAKLSADAKAAESKVTDLDSFKAQMAIIGKNCGGCHKDYRMKKS